jgi:hypothetical protein
MGEGESATISAKLARVRERIAKAAARSGRSPEDIRLVVVSKLVAVERVREAIAAGAVDLGENYVQEAAAKRESIGDPVRWHLIGHLQRNKAAQAAALFDMVHTIDEARTAAALGRQAWAAGRVVEILLQVNTSGEPQKSGVAPTGVRELLEAVHGGEGLQVRGLMTIGRFEPDPEAAREEFRGLARLAREVEQQTGIAMRWLSMGMTHDFEVAIEEGSNLVRVGTGVFGERPRVES